MEADESSSHSNCSEGSSHHKCPICEKTFSTQGNLTRHTNATHNLSDKNSREKSQGALSCTTFVIQQVH